MRRVRRQNSDKLWMKTSKTKDDVSALKIENYFNDRFVTTAQQMTFS